LARAVVAGHVRSLLASHLLDVESSDQHTVKPWFHGRVDFAPPVPSPPGYPLVGGRLDYLDNQKVVALVYMRNKHVINLFIWPETGSGEEGLQLSKRQGYHLFHWTRQGFTYWAVSDLNTSELQEFVELIMR